MKLYSAYARVYPAYKSSRFAERFKRRRYRTIIDALRIKPPATILDIGCGTGADFIRFAMADGFSCHGLDIARQERVCEFAFTQADACRLPFPDHHFDSAVSVGLFEHIQPIEDLCKAANEISRVAKNYCVVVPSIGTLLEPHSLALLWGLRDRNSKRHGFGPLNFYSDEAWLQFSGFRGAMTKRFWYMPGVQNLAIYHPLTM